MSQKNEENVDPAGSTVMFQKFVSDNDEPEAAPRRSMTPYVLAGVGAVVAVAIIVAVVVTWS
ncbi:hypothetical protein O4J56_28495 [Nocardiopsis sp. RSe5-2]|uniref:Ssl1498 family light-harvesting-like protein n=1 Tax=Nocardiopsis endophytica TaxID=3018445 RepID=A0ABT4UE68_9ACTN|nr:hypothetical protein [Nocardiopsis endophytica]MDA2814617.1 hypothetical protein [Nocardiopsis endophytica]